YARLIAHAGANALELNFYYVATDGREDGRAVERRVIDIVAVLKESLRLPLAVKVSPFYSSLPNLAAQLENLGADALVLFNRFYHPDIDPERREAALCLRYSDSSELPLRLRWIAILAGRTRMALTLTGGVHEPLDAVKALMAGADTVQMVSVLMHKGPEWLAQIRQGVERWAETHQVASLQALRGCASLSRCGDPRVFERGNYVEILRRKSDSDGVAVSFS
ncbi:MAG: dihydroorotate dehydrogenase-like protein, partial [Acidobacteria bacterium]|nr:dihydroorotate dehydrogenase-like protein [Acidobacteriota bacterium]